jgi:hypothetical protein
MALMPFIAGQVFNKRSGTHGEYFLHWRGSTRPSYVPRRVTPVRIEAGKELILQYPGIHWSDEKRPMRAF